MSAPISEDHLGGPLGHAGDRHQQRHLRLVRDQQLVDRHGERLHRGVGLVDAGEHRPTQQGVVLVEPAGHGIVQLGDLRTHPAFSHLGQHIRIALTGDQHQSGAPKPPGLKLTTGSEAP